jgi:hypothetical protein
MLRHFTRPNTCSSTQGQPQPEIQLCNISMVSRNTTTCNIKLGLRKYDTVDDILDTTWVVSHFTWLKGA